MSAPPEYLEADRMYRVIGGVQIRGDETCRIFKLDSEARQYPVSAAGRYQHDAEVTFALITLKHHQTRWYAMIHTDREYWGRAYEAFVWGRWARSLPALRASLAMVPISVSRPSLVGGRPDDTKGLTRIPLRYRGGTP